MTIDEARQLLAAFEAGYVAYECPDLRIAEKILGKVAKIDFIKSMSNPDIMMPVRKISDRQEVKKSPSTVEPEGPNWGKMPWDGEAQM